MQRKRYFTVDEANRLIPALEGDFSKARRLRQELAELGAELTALFEVIHHNGGHRKSPQFIQAAQAFRQVLEHIQSYGCVIKDLDPGLVDFLHLRDGREVYLCWKGGEAEIRYWHDIDAGFGGRQPI